MYDQPTIIIEAGAGQMTLPLAWAKLAADPQPWLEAKPGEVWELVREFAPEKANPLYIRTESGWRPVARRKSIHSDSEFVAGRRIWPEVTK